jgi:hypothetical protein
MPSNSNWFLQFFNDEEDDYTYNKDISSKPCDIPNVFVSMVYLINSSNGAVSDDQCNRIVEALNIQLQTFCDDWSIKPVILARSVTPPSGSYQIILTSDTQFTLPGVYGYHMPPLADGTIKAYVSVNVIIPVVTTPLPTGTTPSPNGILYPSGTNGTSVARVVSHELLQILVRQGLNRLYFINNTNEIQIRPRLQNGNEITGEFLFIADITDAVNDQSYTIITSDSTKVQVSDYVMPSWYSVVGKAPFNYNNTLQGPLTVSTGGYYDRLIAGGPYVIKYR